MQGYQVATVEDFVETADIFVTTTVATSTSSPRRTWRG